MLINRLSENSITKKPTRFDNYVDRFFANWVWRATHALIDHQDFNGSPSWVSKKLGVSIEESVEALEGLEYLGFLKKTASGFETKGISFLDVNSDDENTRKQMIKDHRIVTEQILNKMFLGNYQSYRLDFTASNRDLIIQFCRDYWKLTDKLKSESDSNATRDNVYGLTFSMVELSKEDSQEEF